MKAILFILLAFGPFIIFIVRGLLNRNEAEAITVKGVEVFFHWFISLLILTFLIRFVGLGLVVSVIAVILHHIVWVLVAYYGEERSWKFVKETWAKVLKKKKMQTQS